MLVVPHNKTPHEKEDVGIQDGPLNLHFLRPIDPMEQPNRDSNIDELSMGKLGHDYWSLTVIGSGGSKTKLTIPAVDDSVVAQSISDVSELDLDTLRARFKESMRLIHGMRQTIQMCYLYLEPEREAQLKSLQSRDTGFPLDENVVKFEKLANSDAIKDMTPNLMARGKREDNQDPCPLIFRLEDEFEGGAEHVGGDHDIIKQEPGPVDGVVLSTQKKTELHQPKQQHSENQLAKRFPKVGKDFRPEEYTRIGYAINSLDEEEENESDERHSAGGDPEQNIETLHQPKQHHSENQLGKRFPNVGKIFRPEEYTPIGYAINSLDEEEDDERPTGYAINSLDEEEEHESDERHSAGGDPEQNIETLWKWLNDEHIGTIRIRGEAGIGKTWTARQLMNKAIAADLFDVIIWVHGGLSYYEALMKIADQLNVTLDERTYWVPTHVQEKESELRRKISESLADKHFLLFLDDISKYNSQDLGVPHPKEQNKSSKVLIVGGSETHFSVEKVRKLEKLSKHRAWLLFQEITGSISELGSPRALELAQRLLESCKWVPFEIVILAGTLQSRLPPEDKSLSSTLLRSEHLLENITKAYNLKIIQSEEMTHVQFIYEMLADKAIKDCFMVSCICPKYYQFTVKELIMFWMKSGSLDGCDSFEEAYEKGQNILRELINRCLFFKNTTLNGRVDLVTVSVQAQLINEAIEYVTSRWFDLGFLKKYTLSGGTGVTREKLGHQQNSTKNGENLDESLSLVLYVDGSHLPDEFELMPNLEDVSLLHVQIRSLPPALSKLNHLHVLVLRGCDTLENVNQISGLQNLRILSLSGSSSLKDIPDDIFQKMGNLETLDLSNTQLNQLPSSFSGLNKLRFLILRGCFSLEILPSLEEFHQLSLLDLSGASKLKSLPETSKSLRMLDLSRTLVDTLPLGLKLSELEYLILRHCRLMRTVTHPCAFPQLKVLDLSGSHAFKEFKQPDVARRISKWPHLKFLEVPNRKFLWGFDWVDRNQIFEQLKWDLSESEGFGIVRIHITVRSTNIFLFIQNLELWRTLFQRFNLCLCSTGDWGNERDIYLQGRTFVFRDVYYQTIHIPQLTEEPDRFFKICGFQTFPDGIEHVLRHAELVYLKRNDFITRLSDMGATFYAMTQCWIERCDRMEAIFYGEEINENLALGRWLENLLVSCLSELKFLFKGPVRSGSFICLKHMYVDCCPSLITMFSSYVELRKLEKLEIKFCGELENICGEMAQGHETLPMLKTLILFQLPKLKNICGGLLPSIEKLQVKGCSELRKVPVNNSSSRTKVKIRGELVWWDNLQWEDEEYLSYIQFTQL